MRGYLWGSDSLPSPSGMGSRQMPPPSRVLVCVLFPSPGLDRWFPLTAATKHDEVQGEVLMEIVLTDHGTGGDHIKALVTVVEARSVFMCVTKNL